MEPVYAERPAPAGLACLWTRTVSSPTVQRVVPDGCTDLMWTPSTGALNVAGPDTQAQLASVAPGTLYGVRLPPGAFPSVFGVPAHAVRDLRVPLTDLVPSARLESFTSMVEFCASRVTVDPVLTATAALLRTGDVTTAAWEIGLSERQLRRRCLDAFGYPPKVLQRVLRFDSALRLAWTGVPFATVAAEAGYADQAHLAREVRALAGVSLGQLIRP
ncbi:Helix-turn-helix domain-containing protein [Lentzea fradiae]|uniref:Helix-turn-helix domain-containing protein n=1 Tax=Lentzea fradiae TaxID=200378 RepID=A0A1G7SE83_9PSEU|nr:helix-turn-helix domain-containing protein [Lentzea fradiae]SDG20520.1 Helix-turn-helix domain-containing protein [Lentzea fradiae]